MLNKLDDVLAPNICMFVLMLCCLFQLVLMYSLTHSFWFYFICVVFIANVLFCLKVSLSCSERNRVYSIVKSRIAKQGYNKTIFSGKCSSICMLTQAVYIAMRFNSYSDFYYFYTDFYKKEIQYIHEDESLEYALNKIDFDKISVGDVVHEYKK